MPFEQHRWLTQAVMLTSCLLEHSGGELWWTHGQQDQAWANLPRLRFVPADVLDLPFVVVVNYCSFCRHALPILS